MKRKVLKYPNKILNQKSEDVTEFNEELYELLDDMRDIMKTSNGVGLAGIQIGVALNVLVIEYQDEYIEVINPEITSTYGERTTIEGCLSVPGVGAQVTRYEKIEVTYQDRFGDLKFLTPINQLATIFQHEIEHLQGGLYIDNLSKTQRKKLEGQYKRVKK